MVMPLTRSFTVLVFIKIQAEFARIPPGLVSFVKIGLSYLRE